MAYNQYPNADKADRLFVLTSLQAGTLAAAAEVVGIDRADTDPDPTEGKRFLDAARRIRLQANDPKHYTDAAIKAQIATDNESRTRLAIEEAGGRAHTVRVVANIILPVAVVPLGYRGDTPELVTRLALPIDPFPGLDLVLWGDTYRVKSVTYHPTLMDINVYLEDDRALVDDLSQTLHDAASDDDIAAHVAELTARGWKVKEHAGQN